MRSAVLRYGFPAVFLAALVVPALAVAPRLPDPIAIHWGWSGAPDGHAPWWVVTAGAAVLWCAAWAALLASAERWTAASGYSLGGILIVAHSTGLWANLDAPAWSDARRVTWYLILAVILAAVASGSLGWVLAPPSAAAGPPAGPLPSAGLRAGEQAVWWGTARNRWLLAVVPIAIAVAALLGSSHLARVGVVIGLVSLVFSFVRVLVGPTGVQVRVGLVGWPRRTLLYRDIEDATAERVVPMAYGGWGWRRRPGRTAVVIRDGEGLRLRLTSGRLFVVTVDDAERGAGLINDYVTRDHARTS
jgi:hypothetical protein